MAAGAAVTLEIHCLDRWRECNQKFKELFAAYLNRLELGEQTGIEAPRLNDIVAHLMEWAGNGGGGTVGLWEDRVPLSMGFGIAFKGTDRRPISGLIFWDANEQNWSSHT